MKKSEFMAGLIKRVPGGSVSTADFRHRLIVQKLVYLLQSFGIDLDYRFRWYLYGPYSTELAKDAYNLTGKTPEALRLIDPKAEARFNEFLDFLGDKSQDEHWLELIASTHFLTRMYPEEGKDEIFKRIKQKHTSFNSTEFNEGWQYLKQGGLLKDD